MSISDQIWIKVARNYLTGYQAMTRSYEIELKLTTIQTSMIEKDQTSNWPDPTKNNQRTKKNQKQLESYMTKND